MQLLLRAFIALPDTMVVGVFGGYTPRFSDGYLNVGDCLHADIHSKHGDHLLALNPPKYSYFDTVNWTTYAGMQWDDATRKRLWGYFMQGLMERKEPMHPTTTDGYRKLLLEQIRTAYEVKARAHMNAHAALAREIDRKLQEIAKEGEILQRIAAII